MLTLNFIKKLLGLKQEKAGVAVFQPTPYAEMLGMKKVWVFDLDKSGNPILSSASQKAKWEMCTGRYAPMFDKTVTL